MSQRMAKPKRTHLTDLRLENEPAINCLMENAPITLLLAYTHNQDKMYYQAAVLQNRQSCNRHYLIYCKIKAEAHDDLEAFNSHLELGFLSLEISLLDVKLLVHFPTNAASILCLSIFEHKIGVLKSPTLFQGKEL